MGLAGGRERLSKIINWGGKSQREEQFLWGDSHYVVLTLYFKFQGYCKSLYRIPLFTVSVLLVLTLLIYMTN